MTTLVPLERETSGQAAILLLSLLGRRTSGLPKTISTKALTPWRDPMNWSVLLPYDFSPLTVLAYLLAAVGYIWAFRALPHGERPGPVRVFAFFLGLGLCYAVMQTRFDYYAQYMFFIHRGQHLILHHLGPVLIALSNPLPILRFWHQQLAPALGAWVAPCAGAITYCSSP